MVITGSILSKEFNNSPRSTVRNKTWRASKRYREENCIGSRVGKCVVGKPPWKMWVETESAMGDFGANGKGGMPPGGI